MSGPRALFLYGTLMDEDILPLVLGRRVGASMLAPAVLHDHRRGYIAGMDFPGLMPLAGALTPGVVLQGVSVADVMRLSAYEGKRYRLGVVEPVRQDDQTVVSARAYLVKPGVTLAGEWDLAGWQARHKPAYMRRWFG